jgi:hypothetical protein
MASFDTFIYNVRNILTISRKLGQQIELIRVRRVNFCANTMTDNSTNKRYSKLMRAEKARILYCKRIIWQWIWLAMQILSITLTKRLRRNSATNFWGYARFREIIVTKYCVKFHKINFNFVFKKKTDFHIHLYMHIGLFSAWGCPWYCWRPITLMTTLNTVPISGLRMYILVLLRWIII